jgi:hypothetical protein
VPRGAFKGDERIYGGQWNIGHEGMS